MLASVDWPAVQRRAAEFLRAHPSVRVADLTRAERTVIPGAAEAWSVLHHKAAATIRGHGAQPCDHCGEWTGYCEGCTAPPRAICTACDRDRLLCRTCVSAGKVFAEVQRLNDPGVLEVSGFHDEEGNFVRLPTPIRIPAEEVPCRADGTFDTDQLMALLEARGRPGRGTAPSSR